MTSTSSIAASGLQTAQMRLNSTAHNVANGSTEGFRRQVVASTEQAGGGVRSVVSRSGTPGPALEADVVSRLQAKNEFLTNLAVFKTNQQMVGTLLDKTV